MVPGDAYGCNMPKHAPFFKKIVEGFGILDSESKHSRRHLMGHPSMDEQDSRAESYADYGESVQCFRGEQ